MEIAAFCESPGVIHRLHPFLIRMPAIWIEWYGNQITSSTLLDDQLIEKYLMLYK